MRKRPAARLFVFDPKNRLLLFKFVFENGPMVGSRFWATPGGAVENGESFRQTAQRELLEETGIDLDVGSEIGRRKSVFQIPSGEYVQADERFFYVRTASDRVDESGQQAFERQFMREYRWWTLAELGNSAETVYPEELFELLKRIPDLRSSL